MKRSHLNYGLERVIEILRFTTKAQWYYVQTKDMLADIGTRKGVALEDIN